MVVFVVCCTVLYCTVPYNNVLYCTVLYRTVQVVFLVAVFVACWTPYALMGIAGILGFSEVTIELLECKDLAPLVEDPLPY